jgi:hypothetical protein
MHRNKGGPLITEIYEFDTKKHYMLLSLTIAGHQHQIWCSWHHHSGIYDISVQYQSILVSEWVILCWFGLVLASAFFFSLVLDWPDARQSGIYKNWARQWGKSTLYRSTPLTVKTDTPTPCIVNRWLWCCAYLVLMKNQMCMPESWKRWSSLGIFYGS